MAARARFVQQGAGRRMYNHILSTGSGIPAADDESGIQRHRDPRQIGLGERSMSPTVLPPPGDPMTRTHCSPTACSPLPFAMSHRQTPTTATACLTGCAPGWWRPGTDVCDHLRDRSMHGSARLRRRSCVVTAYRRYARRLQWEATSQASANHLRQQPVVSRRRCMGRQLAGDQITYADDRPRRLSMPVGQRRHDRRQPPAGRCTQLVVTVLQAGRGPSCRHCRMEHGARWRRPGLDRGCATGPVPATCLGR